MSLSPEDSLELESSFGDGLCKLPLLPAESTLGMPRLHYCCYTGKYEDALRCVLEGDDINQRINLINQYKEMVLGVTPLYIAAQEGHLDICKVLVRHGADLRAKCFIPSSRDIFGPAEISLVQLHFRVWWYLNSQKTKTVHKNRALSYTSGQKVAQPLLLDVGAD